MKKLIIKLIFLFIPVAIFVGICLAVGLDVGEVYPLSTIAQMQSQNRDIQYDLIGPGLKHLQYKYESILVQEPQIVLMGSSRTWYFREHVANRCPAAFYNASYGNSSVFEMAHMLEKIIAQDKSPEVILLSIDYPEYNGDSDYREEIRQLDELSALEYFIDSGKRTLIQVLLNPTTVMDLLSNAESRTRLGWGFVDDGSPNYYNGDGSHVETKFDDYYLPTGLDIHHVMLEQGELQYQPGSTVDEGALLALDKLLQLAADNNIEIIGFIPPFHEEIRNRLQSDGDFVYIALAHKDISDLFDAHRFPLYDFSDPETVGGSEDGMYDGWHSGERLSTQIYLEMLNREPEILSKYSDADVLEDMINNADNPYILDIDRSQLGDCE